MSNNTINLNNVKITQKILPLSIMTGFVEAVVDSCVDETTGEYLPQSYDLAIKLNTVLYYSDYSLPDKLDEQYRILLESDLYDFITDNINKTQYREMLRAIDRKIKFKLDCISYSLTTPAKQIIDKINNLISENQKTFETINKTDINELIKSINDISNRNDKDISVTISQEPESNTHTDISEDKSKIISLTQSDEDDF